MPILRRSPFPGRGPLTPYRFFGRQLAEPLVIRMTQQYAEGVNAGDPASNFDRMTQQYVEAINSGALTSNFNRLTQQYVEASNTGAPASQFVRLTQQYVEVLVPYPSTDPTNTFFLVM